MRSFTLSFSALLALCAPARAEQTPAEQNIGSATLIEKTVEGLTAERNMRLKTGDAVFFNELLTTGQQSKGAFLFDDRATLQLGPQSQVRLDNFVYAKDTGGTPGLAFNVTKGALRFMSAGPAHKPYEVRTTHATIGVRGTAFAVRALETRMDAVLYEGAIEICLPNGGACRSLDKPCTTLAVTETGFEETRSVGAKDWTFDAQCRTKETPAPKRRHGALEPPPSPPPAFKPKQASLPSAPKRERASRPDRDPPPRLQSAHVEPPPKMRPKPVRVVDAEQNRPRRPHRPPVYDAPEIDDGPDYPPPRVVHFPVRAPVIYGGGPWRPHFPGGWGGPRPGGWGGAGGNYPQGPRGGYGGGMSRF